MAWSHVQYEYPVHYEFEKIIIWMDSVARLYVGTADAIDAEWSYYAGVSSGDHGLAAGLTLTSKTDENTARSDYWRPTPDSNDRVIAVFSPTKLAKVIRLYIDSDNDDPTQIYEFRPSTRLMADEIITGQLHITDQFASSPAIKITVSSQERVFIGDLGSDLYGIRGRDSSGNVIFELKSDEDHPFMENYADHHAIELELMKVNFQNISWSSLAIFDALDDETKRASPDISEYDARVYKSQLDNGDDDTVDKQFGFMSKTYTDITTILSSTSTSVGLNFLTDTEQSWFTNECTNLTLVDSGANEFNVTSNTSNTLTVAGTPASGAYTLVDDDPQYMVGFASLSDSTNGGTGYIKYEVSFDGGSHYQVIYDTINSPNIDLRQGTMDIDDPGNDYIVKITLKNDGSGDGAVMYKWLICTDPSPWRY